jgi:hypothetical protein
VDDRRIVSGETLMRSVSSLLIGLFLTTMLGCGGNEKPVPELPPKDKPNDKPVTPKPIQNPETPPKYSLTAEEYFKEWNKDSKAANAKYADVTIELSGTVGSVGLGNGRPLLQLNTGDQLQYVHCWTTEKEPWVKAVDGQKVKVRGKVLPSEGRLAQIGDCKIVETGPSPAITVDAASLATEYAKDKQATIKKYEQKILILTGEIAEKRKDDNSVTLVLKGGNDVEVNCGFLLISHASVVAPLTVGQQVKVVGEFNSVFTAKDKAVGIWNCNLITSAK